MDADVLVINRMGVNAKASCQGFIHSPLPSHQTTLRQLQEHEPLQSRLREPGNEGAHHFSKAHFF